MCIRPMKDEWPVISAFWSRSGVDEGIDWGVEDDADVTTTNGLGLDATRVNLLIMSLRLTYEPRIIDLPSLITLAYHQRKTNLESPNQLCVHALDTSTSS